MTQKLIIENPRISNIDGKITYTPDLLFDQVKRTIEKELLKRNILVDIIEINFKKTKYASECKEVKNE